MWQQAALVEPPTLNNVCVWEERKGWMSQQFVFQLKFVRNSFLIHSKQGFLQVVHQINCRKMCVIQVFVTDERKGQCAFQCMEN